MSITITTEYEAFGPKRLLRFEPYISMYGNIYRINKEESPETQIITKDIANRLVKLQAGPSISIDGERHVTTEVYNNGMQAWQEVANNIRNYDFKEDIDFAKKHGLDQDLEMRATRLEMDIDFTLNELEPTQ